MIKGPVFNECRAFFSMVLRGYLPPIHLNFVGLTLNSCLTPCDLLLAIKYDRYALCAMPHAVFDLDQADFFVDDPFSLRALYGRPLFLSLAKIP
jgi:hypothetical protein